MKTIILRPYDRRRKPLLKLEGASAETYEYLLGYPLPRYEITTYWVEVAQVAKRAERIGLYNFALALWDAIGRYNPTAYYRLIRE